MKKTYLCAVCGDEHFGDSKIVGLEEVVTRLVQCVIVLRKKIEGLEERETLTGKE